MKYNSSQISCFLSDSTTALAVVSFPVCLSHRNSRLPLISSRAKTGLGFLSVVFLFYVARF